MNLDWLGECGLRPASPTTQERRAPQHPRDDPSPLDFRPKGPVLTRRILAACFVSHVAFSSSPLRSARSRPHRPCAFCILRPRLGNRRPSHHQQAGRLRAARPMCPRSCVRRRPSTNSNTWAPSPTAGARPPSRSSTPPRPRSTLSTWSWPTLSARCRTSASISRPWSSPPASGPERSVCNPGKPMRCGSG